MKRSSLLSLTFILSIVFKANCLCLEGTPQCDLADKYRRFDYTHLSKGFNDPISWDEANEYCKSIGSELATIKSLSDAQDSKTACNGKDKRSFQECWIGLRSTHPEYGNDIDRKWKWANDEYLNDTNFSYWGTEEPSSQTVGHTEDCVLLYPTSNPSFSWNDFNCNGSSSSNTVNVEAFLCNNPDYDTESACLCNCHSCSIAGDPHIYTFDDLLYHPQGNCTYYVAEACDGDHSVVPFSISVGHGTCFKEGMSCVKDVYLTVYDTNSSLINDTILAEIKITDKYSVTYTSSGDELFGEDGDSVKFNEYITLGDVVILVNKNLNDLVVEVELFITDIINKEYSDGTIIVSGDYGEKIRVEDIVGTNSFVHIHLSECWMGTMCGLCGSYNNNIDDEFTLSFEDDNEVLSSSDVSDFTLMTNASWENVLTMLDSWQLTSGPYSGVNRGDCQVEVMPDCPDITLAEETCNCVCLCSDNVWLESCIWDVCQLQTSHSDNNLCNNKNVKKIVFDSCSEHIRLNISNCTIVESASTVVIPEIIVTFLISLCVFVLL